MRDKINSLIDDIQRHPFTGLGKPEPLKRNLRGYWSRRITREHRLVYRVQAGVLQIAQCRFHY
jgi:toxin YoeB